VVPHIATRETHQRSQKISVVTPKKDFSTLSANTGSEKPYSITSLAPPVLFCHQFSFVGEVNFVARSSSPNIALFQHGRSMSRGLKRLRVCLSRRRIYLEPSPTREPRRILRRIL
jgi:hypothetical protein